MHISTSSHSSTPSFFSNLTPKSGKDWLLVAGVVAVATAAIFVSYKAALLVGALTAVGYKAVKSSQPASASVNQRAAALLNPNCKRQGTANPNDGTGNPTPHKAQNPQSQPFRPVSNPPANSTPNPKPTQQPSHPLSPTLSGLGIVKGSNDDLYWDASNEMDDLQQQPSVNSLPISPQSTTISQPQPAPPRLVLKNQEKEREALFNLIDEVSLVAQSSQPAKALIEVNGRREWRDAPPNWVSDRIPTRLLGIWIESCGIPNIIRPIEQNGNLATTITQNEKITDFNRPAYYFLVDPSGSHYALLEVSWAAKEAIIFNSMNCSQDEMESLLHAANGKITQLCDSFHPSSRDKRLRTTSYVFDHQKDFSSCGFYAMHYIKQRIAGKNSEQIRTEVPNIAQFKQSEIQKLKSHIDSRISPERIRLHREYIEQNVHGDTEEYIVDQMGHKKLLFSAFAKFYHV